MDKERYMKYVQICERAEKEGISKGDRMGSLMDIESADLKFNMSLDEWLNADKFNFAHDFCGIQNTINRRDFPAIDFGLFVPRFAAPGVASKTVDIVVYGILEKAVLMDKDKLLKMNVRYVGTDTKLSQRDIYENEETGEYYATNL